MNWLLSFLIPLFFAGCASERAYRHMRHEAEKPAASDYYRSEISEPVIHASLELTDPTLADVETRLRAAAQKWQDADKQEADAGAWVSADVQREAAARNADPAKLAAVLKEPLPLPLFLALVQERNPSIAAARQDLRAALLRYPQATALDDILAQYNAFTKQLDTLMTDQPQKSMVSMQFPFPDVAALKGQVVTLEVAQARLDLDIRTRDVLTEARMGWYRYAYLDAALGVARQNAALLDNLASVVQTRYSTDQSLYGDLVTVKMELASVTEEAKALTDRLGATKAQLNALLDRPGDAALASIQELPDEAPNATLPEITDLALRQRQELQRQRVAIERMETMTTMAARMAIPDPTPGASYLETRAKAVSGTAVADDMGAGTFGTSPRLNVGQAAAYGRESAYIRETRVRIEAMKRMLSDMENETRALVHDRWADVETARRRNQTLYRGTQIPLARQALKSAEAAYTTGKADFATYIEAQRTLLRSQLEEKQAQRDLQEAVARLEQATGGRLPTRPVAESPVPATTAKE